MSNLSELLAIKQEVMSSIHCALPGYILSYDSDHQTADVQIAVKARDGKEFPILKGVPVYMPLTFTVNVNAHCLVVFADIDVDSWVSAAEVAPAGSDRMHNLSDGFVFVGFDSGGGQGGGGGDMSNYYTKSEVDTALGGKKDTQTAVVDPSADGDGVSFIDSISQATDGKVSVHKKTVSGMQGASSLANGAAGLVPKPLIADRAKYLRGDGTWETPGGGFDPTNYYTKSEMDTALSGKKGTQAAVTDPVASGNSVTFIDSISQDSEGVITPTKKTVRTMSGATSLANGTTGLVPMPSAGDQDKYLKGDGTWEAGVFPGTTVVEYASSDDFSAFFSPNANYTVRSIKLAYSGKTAMLILNLTSVNSVSGYNSVGQIVDSNFKPAIDCNAFVKFNSGDQKLGSFTTYGYLSFPAPVAQSELFSIYITYVRA